MYGQLYVIAHLYLDIPLLLQIVRIFHPLALGRMAEDGACLSFHLLSTSHVTASTVVATSSVIAHVSCICTSHTGVGTTGWLALIPYCALILISTTL